VASDHIQPHNRDMTVAERRRLTAVARGERAADRTRKMVFALVSCIRFNTFRDKTKTLWETADTLSQAQKYAEAKEKMIQILRMNPDYTPALEKKKELDQILSQQAQRLYSQAVVYESLPDIEGAKEKWRTILTLLDTSHLYYKKAQQKLSHYSSY